MIELKHRLKRDIFERVRERFPLALSDIELAPTPNQAMGDLALAFPLQLAKKIKANPRKIAQEVLELIGPLEGVTKAEIAGAGFINLFLDRKAFFRERALFAGPTGLAPEEAKIIIEHTNINPNKAAHIGHLRNAVLGDTLARCLRFKGENVEVQNYIDDTGVQVVDVVYGIMELEKKGIPDLEALEGKFDYYCWDLYARVSAYLADHPEARARKAEIMKGIEHGEDAAAQMARYVSRRIVRAHLATMRRIGIGYDVLPCESSILHLKFWEKAFALLKEKGAIYLQNEGDNKGCWVMKLEEDEEREKIIVRSDGTVTYVGKDIAYQLWKFGLLEKDFYYEPFLEEGGKTLWISTAEPRPESPHFGAGSKVFNVIDTRQAYLQKVVTQGLRALKFDAQAAKSVHFSYEMVALSPKSLEELGYKATEEEKDRAFLEVSGRKGLGVKADDLLDRLEEKARTEVEKRNPGLDGDMKKAISRDIASGALRYFMLKFARNSLIIFDFEEALNFEGETGPYLQYTCVRLRSIFRKLEERTGTTEAAVRAHAASREAPLELLGERESADLWDLVLYAAGFEEEVLRSATLLESSHLAKFTFNLCQRINTYYHHYPVLAEENPDLRATRALTLSLTRNTLEKALFLMGIPLPERM
ncbi:MAG TPA: arginine--tRNA ligase [Acidobacteriota bacterium]|nr:arginine--tRNA ligase [Acidobacteriota bacterium]